MNTIQEIAHRLTGLLREKQFVQAYQELFADDTKSIDPLYAALPPLKNLSELIDREKQFLSRATIHAITISDPIVSGSYFTLKLAMDFSTADQGRKEITELCVYQVAAGKIITQQFFIG